MSALKVGQMTLFAHLREFRLRLFKSSIAIILLSFLGWFEYDFLINKLAAPVCDLSMARSSQLSSCGVLYINGVLGPIDLKFKISFLIGFILASPIWIYQLWAFIAPGLHKKEKRNSILFSIFAVPFFAIGVYVGYSVLPLAVRTLLGFTPTNLNNLVRFDDYLNFVVQILIVFGIAFELPVFLLSLNLIGVLSGRAILKPWRFATFGILLFSAIFTPTGDPFTMLLLGIPLILLYFLAGFISLVFDKRKTKQHLTL